LSVVNGINMSIYERLDEFGTVRALGNRTRDVRNLIITEGLLLGSLGAAMGLVVGGMVIAVVRVIGIPMPPPPNANLGYTAFIRLVPSVIVMAYCVGVAGAALAAVLPAFRISRMPIVDALRAGR
jgi:putative ABC transport system permease protein